MDELERIEKGKQNQHEASYRIGMLLKEMYVDKKIDMEKEKKTKNLKIKKNISYEDYKKQQLND